MREKVGKSRNTVFFQWFVAPEGRKVGSLKRRVRSQLARWEMKSCTPLWREAHFEVKMHKTPQLRTTLEVAMSKKCTPLWREAHFQIKMYKTHHGRTTFGSCDVEKVHAVVARSTFPSQNVQNTPWSDHFWKFTRLWREAHFEVKMYKTHHCRTTFGSCDVEKVHAVVVRSTFPSQNVQSTKCSRHFWKLRCRKSVRRCGAKHISKSKCTKHHMFAPLFGGSDVEKVQVVAARSTFPSQNVQNTTCSRHFWRFGCWKSARHCGAKHMSQVKMYKTPHVRATFGGSDVASLRDTTLQYIQYTTLQYTTLHSSVHSTTLNYTTPHYITLNDTATQIDR